MNDDKRPFPCCDLLTEARLDGHELIYDLSKLCYYLKQSEKCGDYDGDEESSLNYAKQAKEQICVTVNSLMKIRDKITFWQAWASDDSPLS